RALAADWAQAACFVPILQPALEFSIALEYANHTPADTQFAQDRQQPRASPGAVHDHPHLQRAVRTVAQVMPRVVQRAVKVDEIYHVDSSLLRAKWPAGEAARSGPHRQRLA